MPAPSEFKPEDKAESSIKVSKRNLYLFWGFVSVLAVGYVIARICESEFWSECISFIGIISSVVGVGLTLTQIRNVEEITTITNFAVAQTEKKINDFLGYADASKLPYIANLVLSYYDSMQLRSASIYLDHLSAILTSLYNTYFSDSVKERDNSLQANKIGQKLSLYLTTITIDLGTLNRELARKSGKMSARSRDALIDNIVEGKRIIEDIKGLLKNTVQL